MSCFAGFYHFDGKPADPMLLSAMARDIARKGPDGGRDHCDGSLGMSYRAFHTTRESHWEVQPLVSHRGEVLCWDGRLDNREELCDLLGNQPTTDADFALAAYQKWGEEFLAHLVGDFALALFDPHERQVLLGRDFFGPRPLYYVLREERLMWSTDLLPLLRYSGVDLALDEDYVAQYLLMSVEPHRTPYANLHALEPGHLISFRDGEIETNAWYWKPDLSKEVRYKTDREYEEHFYQLFRGSIKARLRSDDRPVWADLSGGLDSSSIVCMADEIMTSERTDCPRLDTWTAINGSSIFTNELPYVRSVEEKRSRAGFHLLEDPLWFQDISRFDELPLVPTPLLCVPNRFRILQARMDDANARILLSGHGGDHLLWKTEEPSPELVDLLCNGQLGNLHRQLRTWSTAFCAPYLKILWRYVLLRALPKAITSRFNPERKALRYLTKSRLAKRYNRTPLHPDDPFRLPSYSARLQSSMLQSAIRFIAPELFPACFHVEVRYPFFSLPLAQFLFAIPHSQKQRASESRSLMRRAFRELLPVTILSRESKGSVDEAICRALDVAWEEFVAVLERPISAGWRVLDRRAVAEAATDVIHGGRTNRGDLLRLLALDLFLSAGTGQQKLTAWELGQQYTSPGRATVAPQTRFPASRSTGCRKEPLTSTVREHQPLGEYHVSKTRS